MHTVLIPFTEPNDPRKIVGSGLNEQEAFDLQKSVIMNNNILCWVIYEK